MWSLELEIVKEAEVFLREVEEGWCGRRERMYGRRRVPKGIYRG